MLTIGCMCSTMNAHFRYDGIYLKPNWWYWNLIVPLKHISPLTAYSLHTSLAEIGNLESDVIKDIVLVIFWPKNHTDFIFQVIILPAQSTQIAFFILFTSLSLIPVLQWLTYFSGIVRIGVKSLWDVISHVILLSKCIYFEWLMRWLLKKSILPYLVDRPFKSLAFKRVQLIFFGSKLLLPKCDIIQA